jgi:hypothetical protein
MALTAQETIGLKWSEIPSVDWEGNTPIVQYTHDKKDLIVVDIISHEYESDSHFELYIPVAIEEWRDSEGYHIFLDPMNLKDGMLHDAWISRDCVSKEYEYVDFVEDIKSFSPYISQILCGNSGRLYSVYDMMDHYERKIQRLNKRIEEMENAKKND